jgi:hypothetical protein
VSVEVERTGKRRAEQEAGCYESRECMTLHGGYSALRSTHWNRNRAARMRHSKSTTSIGLVNFGVRILTKAAINQSFIKL